MSFRVHNHNLEVIFSVGQMSCTSDPITHSIQVPATQAAHLPTAWCEHNMIGCTRCDLFWLRQMHPLYIFKKTYL